MHELSLAQSLLEIVLEEGKRHGMNRVKTVRLQVGEMAAVVPDSLSFCFEMLSQETPASGALLEMETVPVVARCNQCHEVFEVEKHVFVCPQCGDSSLDLLSGRDLTVMSIEGETGEEHDPDLGSGGAEHSPGQ